MGRRRKLTRRKRALCWCLILALAAGLGGLQYRYLSYWKPIREAENLGGIGKTVWLMDVEPESSPYGRRRMLRGNERALMAVTIDAYDFPNGWGTGCRSYLDCTDTKALHAAAYTIGLDLRDGDDRYWLEVEIFGRVEDPAGDKVRMELFWTPRLEEGMGETQTLGTVGVPKLDWVKREGMTCFERQFFVPYPDTRFGGEMSARFTLLDWAGKELESWEQTGELSSIGGSEYF